MRAWRLILLSLCLAPLAAGAGDYPLVDPYPEGGAGEGIAVRLTRSMYQGVGERFDYLPVNLYFGDHAYWNADRVGLKFDLGAASRVDFFLAHRYEGTPQDGIPTVLSGMAIREIGTDFGVGYRRRIGGGTGFAELLHNVDGESGGTELRAGYRLERGNGGLRYWPQLTLAWRDAKLNNYYYGVLPGEATATRPAYEADAGLNVELALYASYALDPRWKVIAGISGTLWSSAVRNSPIVASGFQPAISLGLLYDHSPQPAPPEGRPLWVKAYYGLATDCDLAKIVTLQCLSTSTADETTVSSIEIGRTLIERLRGWNVDIAGYLGLLYHDENGRQPNFWQLNAYFKSYWYGLPWNERVKTRLGIGTGLSYASRVPYTEVVSQAERNRPTSKLLTYLDPTVDISVGDLFGSRRMRNTFFGLGVSHRSGIFGFSQLLNNVNGGSNYIYSYLEFAI